MASWIVCHMKSQVKPSAVSAGALAQQESLCRWIKDLRSFFHGHVSHARHGNELTLLEGPAEPRRRFDLDRVILCPPEHHRRNCCKMWRELFQPAQVIAPIVNDSHPVFERPVLMQGCGIAFNGDRRDASRIAVKPPQEDDLQ